MMVRWSIRAQRRRDSRVHASTVRHAGYGHGFKARRKRTLTLKNRKVLAIRSLRCRPLRRRSLMTKTFFKTPDRQRIARRQFLRFLAGSPLLAGTSLAG